MGIQDKIKEIEAEYARTQKNKATEGHLGVLKAKLAKLRTQAVEGEKTTATKGEGFDVQKHGNARIALIGFPSVGKSSFLNMVTEQESQAAAYEFTTLTCIPGKLFIKDAEMQLLDLPGIIEGASTGKGRGRQVIAVAKSADLVIMMLDAQKGEEQKAKLTRELENTGIRLNKEKPDIVIKPQKIGGIHVTFATPPKKITEALVKNVMKEYKIHNAHVKFNEDYDVDGLLDCIEGNRKYIKCIYTYNKIDTISIEDCDRLTADPENAVISCQMNLGIDILMEKIWDQLGLVRIYTKKRSEAPDFVEPLILTHGRHGLTVKAAIMQLHKDMLTEFGYALVWGRSVKFSPMKCGLKQALNDEDVIQIYKKINKKGQSHERKALGEATGPRPKKQEDKKGGKK